jgi:hypothetical protein
VTPPPLVHPLAEVREQLSQVVATFRAEGEGAQPVVFGAHRKPEAVLLSYQAYRGGYEAFEELHKLYRDLLRAYENLAEGAERARSVAAGFGSVRVEGLEPTPDAVTRSERFIRGEITAEEAYAETLRQYRGQ